MFNFGFHQETQTLTLSIRKNVEVTLWCNYIVLVLFTINLLIFVNKFVHLITFKFIQRKNETTLWWQIPFPQHCFPLDFSIFNFLSFCPYFGSHCHFLRVILQESCSRWLVLMYVKVSKTQLCTITNTKVDWYSLHFNF